MLLYVNLHSCQYSWQPPLSEEVSSSSGQSTGLCNSELLHPRRCNMMFIPFTANGHSTYLCLEQSSIWDCCTGSDTTTHSISSFFRRSHYLRPSLLELPSPSMISLLSLKLCMSTLDPGLIALIYCQTHHAWHLPWPDLVHLSIQV